jgi:eukaryotic-like serine/threonine-protein kinase
MDNQHEQISYAYRFGTAEFNEARFELKVAGLAVEVERRALEVLAYLLRHAGEVVTKEELFREVWSGRITVEKVLPNAVNKLRRALGEQNGELITTQARIGYRIDGQVQRTVVGQTLGSALQLSAGASVPGRSHFVLRKQFSNHRGGEVWRAEHSKTRETRIYKFASDAERLRSLKREATLARVLHDALSESQREHFVELIDWNFEQQPYYLECADGGRDLREWAREHLASQSKPQRLALFLQICDAVAFAHSVGVLHKDLKPGNIVIADADANGGSEVAFHVRLTDFGSGRLLEPDRLAALGITKMGMTVTQGITADSTSGTPLYLAPELLAGESPTVKSDVFALGIILYQLMSNQIGKPMVPGWEADIDDELLQEDLRFATDGNPAKRSASAAELAQRLRNLALRANQRSAQTHAAAELAKAELELTRTRARAPYRWALVAALGTGLLLSSWFAWRATHAKQQAETALLQSQAINKFINEDLISRANPLVLAKGERAELKDLLLGAQEKIALRYAGQPLAEATVRGNLATLFGAIDRFDDALVQSEQAISLYKKAGLSDHPDLARVMAYRISHLARLTRIDDANALVATLGNASISDADAKTFWLSISQGTLATAKSQFSDVISFHTKALSSVERFGSPALKDSLRQELIFAHTMQEQYDIAKQLGQTLLSELSQREGNQELPRAITLSMLARAHSKSGDDTQAEAMLQEAMKLMAPILGADHSRSLSALNELFGVAFRRGDNEASLRYASELHERIRGKFGDDHLSTWSSLANLGRVHVELRQDVLAAEKLQQAYTNLQRLQGVKSVTAQDALYSLVFAKILSKDYAGAEQSLAQLDAELMEKNRPSGLWQDYANAMQALIWQAQGVESEQARAHLSKAEQALRPEAGEAADRAYLEISEAARR